MGEGQCLLLWLVVKRITPPDRPRHRERRKPTDSSGVVSEAEGGATREPPPAPVRFLWRAWACGGHGKRPGYGVI